MGPTLFSLPGSTVFFATAVISLIFHISGILCKNQPRSENLRSLGNTALISAAAAGTAIVQFEIRMFSVTTGVLCGITGVLLASILLHIEVKKGTVEQSVLNRFLLTGLPAFWGLAALPGLVSSDLSSRVNWFGSDPLLMALLIQLFSAAVYKIRVGLSRSLLTLISVILFSYFLFQALPALEVTTVLPAAMLLLIVLIRIFLLTDRSAAVIFTIHQAVNTVSIFFYVLLVPKNSLYKVTAFLFTAAALLQLFITRIHHEYPKS